MVAKILLLVLACTVVLAMAEAAAAAASQEHGKKEEAALEPKQASPKNDGGSGEDNGEFTIQLQGGRHISNPQAWERIVKKDKARAQWIADRLDKASKEKNEKKEDNDG